MSHIDHAYAHLFGLYTGEELDLVSQAVEDSVSDPEPEAMSTASTINEDEDDEPLPPPPASGKPKCEKCSGPNLSLTSPYCIACRISWPI